MRVLFVVGNVTYIAESDFVAKRTDKLITNGPGSDWMSLLNRITIRQAVRDKQTTVRLDSGMVLEITYGHRGDPTKLWINKKNSLIPCGEFTESRVRDLLFVYNDNKQI